MHIALTDTIQKSEITNAVNKFASSFLTGFFAALALGSLASVPDYAMLSVVWNELTLYFGTMFF